MKSNLPTKPPQATASPVTVSAPGDHFFLRRFELPEGMSAAEVPGYVELQLEELAPFPLDQLNRGHVVAPGGGAVFVYAAYRRRTPPEAAEVWRQALFVFPDFAPALRLEFPRETLVFLRSPVALTALLFDGTRRLPVCAAARPLAADADSGGVEALRQRLREQVGARTSAEVFLRAARPPEHRPKGLVWRLAGEEGGRDVDVFVPLAECWAMDVRDAAFVEQQRKRLGFDVVLWRIVQGAAALLAILLVGELLLIGGGTYREFLRRTFDRQAPAVAALEARSSLTNRLEEFGRSGLQPFDMLVAVSSVEPVRNQSVWFVSTTAEGGRNLRIDGRARNAGDVNNYVTALRQVRTLDTVPDAVVKSAADGTSFTLTVTFRPDAFVRPTVAGGAPMGGAR